MSKLTISKMPGQLLPRLFARSDLGSLLEEIGCIDRALACHLDTLPLAQRASYLLFRGYERVRQQGTMQFDAAPLFNKLSELGGEEVRRVQIKTLTPEIEQFLTAPADELSWLDPWSLDTVIDSASGLRAVFLMYAGLAALMHQDVPSKLAAPRTDRQPRNEPAQQSSCQLTVATPQVAAPTAITSQSLSQPDKGFSSAIPDNDETWSSFNDAP